MKNYRTKLKSLAEKGDPKAKETVQKQAEQSKERSVSLSAVS